MKHLLFTPSIQLFATASYSDIVDIIENINNELIRRGYSTPVSVSPAPVANTAPPSVRGPLELFWLNLKGVSRVRRTEGRTAEEQAEYNLRHYQGFKDEQIQEILDAAIPEDTGTIIADEDEAEIPEHQLF